MLNTRGVFDPRFGYFARSVLRGSMWARVEVRHNVTVTGGAVWKPAEGGVFTGSTDTSELHYRGHARMQPNNDWRARKVRWAGENVTEHAMRVQLDLQGNEVVSNDPLPSTFDGDAGFFHVNDIVKVIEIYAPYGHPVDGLNIGYEFTVRNPNASSNSWGRTLLCDFIVNNTSGATV